MCRLNSEPVAVATGFFLPTPANREKNPVATAPGSELMQTTIADADNADKNA